MSINSIELYRKMAAYRRELPPCPECGSPTTCVFKAPNRMAEYPKYKPVNATCTNPACSTWLNAKTPGKVDITFPAWENERP